MVNVAFDIGLGYHFDVLDQIVDYMELILIFNLGLQPFCIFLELRLLHPLEPFDLIILSMNNRLVGHISFGGLKLFNQFSEWLIFFAFLAIR